MSLFSQAPDANVNFTSIYWEALFWVQEFGCQQDRDLALEPTMTFWVTVEASACSVPAFWKETWKVLFSSLEELVIWVILSIPLFNKLYLASSYYKPDILLVQVIMDV